MGAKTASAFMIEVIESVLQATDRLGESKVAIDSLKAQSALFTQESAVKDEELRQALVIDTVDMLPLRVLTQILPARGTEITPSMVRRTIQRTIAINTFGTTFAPSEESWADDGRLSESLTRLTMDFLGRVLPAVLQVGMCNRCTKFTGFKNPACDGNTALSQMIANAWQKFMANRQYAEESLAALRGVKDNRDREQLKAKLALAAHELSSSRKTLKPGEIIALAELLRNKSAEEAGRRNVPAESLINCAPPPKGYMC